jgi:hypothetical protein
MRDSYPQVTDDVTIEISLPKMSVCVVKLLSVIFMISGSFTEQDTFTDPLKLPLFMVRPVSTRFICGILLTTDS